MGMTVGERVKEIRKTKGMTLQQVGNLMGVRPNQVFRFEKNRKCSLERAKALAVALGVKVTDLIGEPFEDEAKASLEDISFFRAYAKLPSDDKSRVRKIIDILSIKV